MMFNLRYFDNVFFLFFNHIFLRTKQSAQIFKFSKIFHTKQLTPFNNLKRQKLLVSVRVFSKISGDF
jgi:hypothetical protein